ncbi:MAG: endonuclease [Thermoplasmatales archaeon]|nr:MAG: endonuclease [Thermoplasmatales archaeon]
MKLTPNILYEILLEEFGKANWWPIDKKYHKKNDSDPRFEIILGAILTQNTSWSNVEKALKNLKSKNMLSMKKILNVEITNLQSMIRPSGFFKQKANRIKILTSYIYNKYNGNLDYFFNGKIRNIREELLSLKGIGPETADSIMLYAGNLTIFVVDAYTKRICERLPLDTNISYNEIQEYFEIQLGKNYREKDLMKIYGELHALIVTLAKAYCKKKPNCIECPFKNTCAFKKNYFNNSSTF